MVAETDILAARILIVDDLEFNVSLLVRIRVRSVRQRTDRVNLCDYAGFKVST